MHFAGFDDCVQDEQDRLSLAWRDGGEPEAQCQTADSRDNRHYRNLTNEFRKLADSPRGPMCILGLPTSICRGSRCRTSVDQGQSNERARHQRENNKP